MVKHQAVDGKKIDRENKVKMKISYRFYNNFSREDVLKLKEQNLIVKEGIDVYLAYEGTKEFETLKTFLGENWRDNVSVVDTDFSEKERSDSDFLSISATKILGYPQPEGLDENEEENEPSYPFNIYPYFKNVFEVANTSPDYGMLRGEQIGNFSFLDEPKWGKATVGSVFDSYDSFFATPEAYKTIFEPLGIAFRPVLKFKNQQPLKTVVQIIPQGISKSKLLIREEHLKEISEIPEWNMKKYLLNGKGFFPAFEESPGNYDFFASMEYFGTGGMTLKEMFISQRLYQLLKKHNIKGLKYYPQSNEVSNYLHKIMD